MIKKKANTISLGQLQEKLKEAAVQLRTENPGLIGDETEIGFITGPGIIGFVAPTSVLDGQKFENVSKIAASTAAKFGPIADGAEPSIVFRDKKVIIGFVAPHDIFHV